MSDTALSVPESQKALALLSDYNAADDFADMRQSDVIMSRLSIQQFQSPQVIDGKARPGDVIDATTKEILLPFGEPTNYGTLVPLMFWLEWIEWNPDRKCKKEDKVIDRSIDPNGELAKIAARWEKVKNSEGKEVFRVTEYYNFVVLLPDLTQSWDRKFTMGFARSSHSKGKVWLNQLATTKNIINGKAEQAPMWSNGWQFSTKKESKEGNNYIVPVIGNRKMLNVEYWDTLKVQSKAIREQKMKIVEAMATTADADDSEHAASAQQNQF